ncbi:MAG: HisA/HisF-related TIM barrel protein, partial [Actinomycetota bacterium]
AVDVPVVASGGFGSLQHLNDLVTASRPTGVAFADALHYDKFSLKQIRQFCIDSNIPTRQTVSGAEVYK